VSGHIYRFGPFIVDRISYRVLRSDSPLELTPKLLDLLLHLLDHSGALVTKEQLLDALWPGANVTENALAQAVSELRQALGDDAAAPRFIKTVARRGYRFISPVERIEPSSPVVTGPRQAAAPTPANAAGNDQSIAVMDFTNVSGDPDSAWLSAGIAETVTADLRALGGFRVVDRGRVMEATRRTKGSLQEVADELNVPLAVVGSYQKNGDRIRITGRIVNVRNGEALADAKVDGALESIFELQDLVVEQFSRDLGLATAPIARNAARGRPRAWRPIAPLPKAGFSLKHWISVKFRAPSRTSSALSRSILDMRLPTPGSQARSWQHTRRRARRMRRGTIC